MEPEPVYTYNILVVEDLQSWQNNLLRFLKDGPFNVFISETYQEALYFVRHYHVDALILDINLSGVPYNIDGLQLADQIWSIKPNIKFIIVSGSREWNRQLQSCHFKPNSILDKHNLDPDVLIEEILKAITLEPTRN